MQAAGNIGVDLDSNFSVPALRLDYAGQSDERVRIQIHRGFMQMNTDLNAKINPPSCESASIRANPWQIEILFQNFQLVALAALLARGMQEVAHRPRDLA